MSTMLASLREGVLLEEAERRAVAYSPEQAEEIAQVAAAATSRAAVARGLTSPRDDATAVSLLRDAVALRMRLLRVSRGEPSEPLPRALETMPSLAAGDRAAAEKALEVADPVSFGRLSRAELAELRGSLDRVERLLAPMVEARSLVVIRGTRFGRQAALLLACGLVAYRAILPRVTPPNVSLHKGVTASAFAPGSALAGTLVDGEVEDPKPVVAERGNQAWLAVDLGAHYRLTSVRLVNRQDYGFDDALPFWLEASADGEHWTQLVRRRDHFKDWTQSVDGPVTRWVRVRCESTCTIGLTELEVHGRAASNR